MMRALTALTLAGLLLGACNEAEAPAAPPQPKWPVPPSPDLPMTPAKAREIVGDLPLSCVQLASMKVDMAACDARQNKPVDQEALRTQLRDLRWSLQQQPAEQAAAQCAVQMAELGKTPKPSACWDLGTG